MKRGNMRNKSKRVVLLGMKGIALPEISTVSPVTKPAFSNFSGVKSVFRKLCFVTEELVS